MAKTVQQYIKDVTKALKSGGRYSKELAALDIAPYRLERVDGLRT